MYEDTIEKILNKDPITKNIFLGAFARDELPKVNKYPSCFILNTQPRSKHGEHWLAFFYNDKGKCTFFDSYGQPPSFYGLESYVKHTSKSWTWNQKRIQGNSEFCGFYSIFYLLFSAHKNLNEFYKKFTSNLQKNDEFIKSQLLFYSNHK